MPLRSYIALLILLLYGLCPLGRAALAASGAVSGQIVVGAGDYSGEVDGQEVRSVSTSYQQIALRYEKKGMLGDARAGKYQLMLGYEFNRLAPSVSSLGVRDDDFQEITAKKPFYNATMMLAPGGLPFRLSLFARDLHQSSFVDEGMNNSLPVSNHTNSQGSLIDSQIYTGIENGTHRELGGTLLLGIRNGSYLGLYRDVLSQLPRLLIDYKQLEVRDLSIDRNQQHYRSRDLAFVSLNKLDNWVHYRMRDHVDFLNPENSTTHNQVIIGLIDQIMTRKWINMTNWLKISGDLSYTTDEALNTGEFDRTYLVNMMAIGRREKVSSTIFSSFSRSSDGNTVSLETDLPISLTLEINRDTRLRSRLIYEASQNKLLEATLPESTNNLELSSDQKNATRDCYLDLQLEMLRSRPVVVVPRFEVESRSERNDQDGLAMRVGAEVYSNTNLGKTLTWLGGYNLTTTRSEDGLSDESSTYLENNIYGRVDKEINRSWRVGGDTSLAQGNGSGRNTVSFHIPRMSAQLSTGGGSSKDVVVDNDDSSITRGNLSLYLEHRYQQLQNRLKVSYESLVIDESTAEQFSLTHALDYARQAHRFKWASVLNQGDNSGVPSAVKFAYLATETAESDSAKTSWSSDTSYSYDPNRSIGLTFNGGISGAKTDKQLVTYALSEKIIYRLFTTNGIIRRIAEFSEELGYEKSNTADVNGRNTVLYGRFSAAYFPTRYLYAKLHSEMIRYSNSSQQMVNKGEVGFDFEKLKLVASYTEGKKNRESDDLPEVKERLWNVELKKIF